MGTNAFVLGRTLVPLLLLVLTLFAYFTLHSYNPAAFRLPLDLSYAHKVLLPPVPLNYIYKDSIPCFGVRGQLLTENAHDQLQALEFDTDFPPASGGSHEAINLPKRWFSADGRYGAYGYGATSPNYNRTHVDWTKVDWGHLQDHCLAMNSFRFPTYENNSPQTRRLVRRDGKVMSPTLPPREPTMTYNRTAFVLRTYSNYKYKDEDLWNMRSLVSELSLATGGMYTLFLLVDVHDDHIKVADLSTQEYDNLIRKVVPPEFHGIAVLWDRSLLEDWYPLTESHDPFFQMYQALQLFAHFHPQFDHYWQWEMDARVTGHAAEYFNALDAFSLAEPRKQALERASYVYLPTLHGTYQAFITSIDHAINGTSAHWGPVRIPEIPRPIGPTPRTPHPEDDRFEWGVGEPADVILMSKSCLNNSMPNPWLFHDWAFGFANRDATPRVGCPPAMSRASWNLLNTIHTSQIERGLSVPSEATLPSFALWHGLKIVKPPQPWYYNHPHRPISRVDAIWNGGLPEEHKDTSGFARGGLGYHPGDFPDVDDFGRTSTWGVISDFLPGLLDTWYDEGEIGPEKEKNVPWIGRVHEGKLVLPNMVVHPRKTS